MSRVTAMTGDEVREHEAESLATDEMHRLASHGLASHRHRSLQPALHERYARRKERRGVRYRPMACVCAALVILTAGCSSDEGPRTENGEPNGARRPAEAARPEQEPTASAQAIARGVRWLAGRQKDDGSWRSATYGQMRGGVGNTALVVYGLANGSQDPAARRIAERGARFLLANLAPEGFVRGSEGESDYPTYGTALVLSAIRKMKMEVSPETLGRMEGYLRSAQQNARQGRNRDDLGFGGWNQTGGAETDLSPSSHSNISATRAALEALEAGGALDAELIEGAIVYLERCQNWGPATSGDGGFFFSTDVTDPRNKAGRDSKGRSISYGTTTADGLYGLVICGVEKTSPRRQAAAEWLRKHFDAEAVPGFPDTVNRRKMAEGLFYYQAMTLAACLRRAPELDSAERREALARAIVARQAADGSWRNASPLMNEDDPLIATAMAIAALGMLD